MEIKQIQRGINYSLRYLHLFFSTGKILAFLFFPISVLKSLFSHLPFKRGKNTLNLWCYCPSLTEASCTSMFFLRCYRKRQTSLRVSSQTTVAVSSCLPIWCILTRFRNPQSEDLLSLSAKNEVNLSRRINNSYKF